MRGVSKVNANGFGTVRDGYKRLASEVLRYAVEDSKLPRKTYRVDPETAKRFLVGDSPAYRKLLEMYLDLSGCNYEQILCAADLA